MKKILLIQTAFLGDVILATPLIEKLKKYFPQAEIDFLLRSGNETLLNGHPSLGRLLVWDKNRRKYAGLFRLLLTIRKNQYDLVVNLQRFASTGLLTAFSGAGITVGFDKNPLSFLFSRKIPHFISAGKNPVHEVERNLSLVAEWTGSQMIKPRLYPTRHDYGVVDTPEKYVCMAPASVWFTKMLPLEKWLELIRRVGEEVTIFLLGSPEDFNVCETIRQSSRHPSVRNLAGELTLLQSAALMKDAMMNYVNDSAPLHLASAVNAPVTAFYCSTVPAFGFTPLSDTSFVMEIKKQLTCRPCGLHGKSSCPKGHFDCSDIDMQEVPLPG
jgi:heptosyltransferase-2